MAYYPSLSPVLEEYINGQIQDADEPSVHTIGPNGGHNISALSDIGLPQKSKLGTGETLPNLRVPKTAVILLKKSQVIEFKEQLSKNAYCALPKKVAMLQP